MAEDAVEEEHIQIRNKINLFLSDFCVVQEIFTGGGGETGTAGSEAQAEKCRFLYSGHGVQCFCIKNY